MATRILIADDEPLERRAIRKILETEPDLELLEAENGAEALKVVAETQVTALLLDIKMPGLDGIAVAERLRREHPDVGVIFLTAYDQFDYARSALRLQVDDFLLKPASAEEVVATLRRLLARAASREGARESSRVALQRLESAIALVGQRLRRDLAEGAPEAEQVVRFQHLQGVEAPSLALLECRPIQPTAALAHLAGWAEAWFAGDLALAAVRDGAFRVLLMGDAGPQRTKAIQRFREAVRSDSGCSLAIGVALGSTDPDALVTSAHRAAALATAANPVITVSLAEDQGTRKAAAPTLPPPVKKALALMEERLGDDLSLNDVAAAVGLSPSHLSRQLARATGRGFAECLALCRISASRRYLRDASLTIKEVAHLVGFHDPAYFARVFRKLEGRSPADFRTQEALP